MTKIFPEIWLFSVECLFPPFRMLYILKNYLFSSKEIREKWNEKVQLPAKPFIDNIYSNCSSYILCLENVSKLYSLNLKFQSK